MSKANAVIEDLGGVVVDYIEDYEVVLQDIPPDDIFWVDFARRLESSDEGVAVHDLHVFNEGEL